MRTSSGPGSGFVARLTSPARAATRQSILDELRRGILDGAAPPGMTIPIDEVAARFGVSVIPVREALRTLIGEGLVEQLPRGGYTVARLTLAELQELYTVRGLLEQAAVGAAATRATAAGHAAAQDAHDRLDDALRLGDHPAYHQESRRFHLALVAPAGMHRLQAMLESAWNLTEPYRPMALIGDRDRRRLHADHRLMLDAFVRGDATGLTTCSAEHHDRLWTVIGSLGTGPFAAEE